MADALKAEGNKAFAAKDYDTAIEKFSEAIKLEPQNQVLYSNRSGVYASKKDFAKALDDANKTIEIKGDWAKGWGRKGAALHGSGDLEGAKDAFNEALKLEPTNAQAKSGLAAVEKALDAGAGGPDLGLGKIFSDPQLFQKLAANPKTSAYLADPSFMQTLQKLKSNPNDMQAAFGDPRLLTAMGVLMGVDLNVMGGDGKDGAPDMPDAGEREEDAGRLDPLSSQPNQSKQSPAPAAAPPPPEPEPEDEESRAKKKAREEAEAEKKKGTEFYKKKSFDEAVEHYQKAWDLFKDITYLTNKSAAQYEKAEYEAAIATCKQAIEEGREAMADFKMIAKAFGRMGSAYEKLGNLSAAIDNYQRSLTEHRTPDMLNKLRAAEKAQLKSEKESYVNPEEAEKARELGATKFREGDWPGAVEAYTEMTKRAPDDARGYANRAAALIKLMTFPGAVQDCDTAISKDPSFIKAYLRKAQAYFAMKEYSKCVDVCSEALKADTSGTSHREIEQQQQKALQAQYSGRAGETEEQTMERIQRDPDIMAILQDPVMQAILQQSKENPAALHEHMRNPDVRTKVQKLMMAGVIRTR